MKLATLRDGSRDGQLIVVSKDLGQAHFATHIAPSLQRVLDDWNFMAPQLQDLYDALNQGKAAQAFPFDPRQCLSPLPRAYQWVESLAYGPARTSARWRPIPSADTAKRQPWLMAGNGDHFLGPTERIPAPASADELDFAPGIAVLTGDVHQGASVEAAADSIRLILLSNSLTLRSRGAQEREQAAGRILSRPFTAFSPVAVTRDELPDDWAHSMLHGSLSIAVNGQALAPRYTAKNLDFNFAELIAYLCSTRPCRAGTLLGSGPVCNTDADAELGALEDGDTLSICYLDQAGKTVFGTIEQSVQCLETPASLNR